MYGKAPVFEQVIAQALGLSPLEKVRLVEKLMEVLKQELASPAEESHPSRSLYGVLADLGPAPSEEDIDEIRREMWGNFPVRIFDDYCNC